MRFEETKLNDVLEIYLEPISDERGFFARSWCQQEFEKRNLNPRLVQCNVSSSHFGHKNFVLCLGYKGNAIKDYFLHYDESISNDFVWSEGGKDVRFLNRDIDDWTITFVETGINTNIGQRLKAVEPYLEGEERFLANSGDGLSDLPLATMIETFRRSNAIASLLLVQPTGSSDVVHVEVDGTIRGITPLSRTGMWINGGFFVMRREIFCHIKPGEELVHKPFSRLIDKKALLGYDNGFWQCMDTFKDKQLLEELNHDAAPWKVWNPVSPPHPVHGR